MIHNLFPLDEIPVGELRAVEVDGLSIVVARTGEDKVHALRDVCPHAGAKLSNGSLLKTIGTDADGGYELTEQVAIYCPWHTYEIDVETGRCVADARARVKTFAVEISDGMITLER